MLKPYSSGIGGETVEKSKCSLSVLRGKSYTASGKRSLWRRGKNDGYLYVCDRYPQCDAYVGAHQGTKLPMGTLANGDLRNKRIQAHKAFDWLWKSGLMSKQQAYIWMQAKLGLDSQQAHIAKFSEYMCNQLIIVCDQVYANIQRV